MPDYVYLLEKRLSPAQRNALMQVRDAGRTHGMNVFLTGGAVRDLTTGFPVRDLDFSVQGNALKLKKELEKVAGVEVWGEHEPSRTLFLWFQGVRVEIASARRETYPKPGKPVYEWAPILDDLRRRDFTANAMAVSLNEGSYGLLLDPMNGIADLEARILRLVSPYGFIEDPSRLLRATRLLARTGWELEERTRTRYQNAREENAIGAISPYLRGYEIEEIGHEEDALKALKALEDEGWMKHVFPPWTTARADVHGLEAMHATLLQLLMQGIQPDLSAAQMELLTAKMPPRELEDLKKLFPRPGFVRQWDRLDEAAKEFQKELLDKKNAAPSAAWKLITSYAPEAVLWLAYTSKNAQVQTRFKNFFTVWPEARQKIPASLMLEKRITPDLPGYEQLVQEIFFQLMDGKLTTDEEMRAFLEPHSPPAPPPPVSVRRTRAKKSEPRIKDEEDEPLDQDALPSRRDLEDDSERDSDDEDEDEDDEDVELARPVRAKAPAAAAPAVKPPAPLPAPAPPSAPLPTPPSAQTPDAVDAKTEHPHPAPHKAEPKAAAAPAAAKPAASARPAPPPPKKAPAKAPLSKPVPAAKRAEPPKKAVKPAAVVSKKAAKPAPKPVSKAPKKPVGASARKPAAKPLPKAKKPAAKPLKKKR